MFTQCIIHANRVTVLGVLHDFRMNIIQLQQLLLRNDLLRLAAVQRSTLLHANHMIGKLSGLVQIVNNQNDRCLFLFV